MAFVGQVACLRSGQRRTYASSSLLLNPSSRCLLRSDTESRILLTSRQRQSLDFLASSRRRLDIGRFTFIEPSRHLRVLLRRNVFCLSSDGSEEKSHGSDSISAPFETRVLAAKSVTKTSRKGQIPENIPTACTGDEQETAFLSLLSKPSQHFAMAAPALAFLASLTLISPMALAAEVTSSGLLESLQLQLYNLERVATTITSQQLDHLSALSVAAIFGSGLLTSFSPCTLSMLPICIAYIGGYESSSRVESFVQSLWFSLGIASTLASLGLGAALLGKVYGQIGTGLPIAVSILSIVMGLNLLEVLNIPLPSLGDKFGPVPTNLPKALRSFIIGVSFGFVASPCSTPVLAALLGWVSTTQDPVLGGGLLLSYAAGYVCPLVIAGTFAGALKKLLDVRQSSGWITPTSGAVLLGYGIFTLISQFTTATS